MTESELQNAIASVLFVSGEPVEIERLSEVFELSEEEIITAADKLSERMQNDPFGFVVYRLGDAYQITTAPEYKDVVKKFLEVRRDTPLSNAAMEVLAIVAYNQPVTKSFVEQVRGVESSQIVNKLVERGLIEEAQRLELPGHPIAYRTTPGFLRCFGMTSLDELPPIPQQPEQPETPEEPQS